MSQTLLIQVLGLMIYAVALHLKWDDFRYVLKHPMAVGAGLLAQFVLLPAATLGLTLVLPLSPALAAAMMLVASCPGGALSNVITHLGRGNLALSVSISAVSNVLALVLTPLIFSVLISSHPQTAAWVRSLQLDPRDLWISLLALLALPISLAILTNRFAPNFARWVRKPLENISLVMLLVFIIGAVAGQWKSFLAALASTLPLVVLHNGAGLLMGYLASRLSLLNAADSRAVMIEGGMQNAALAMGIIIAHFSGDAQMMAVASLWGVWHIISGGALALWWRRLDRLSGT
jgi:bile acid:Na+ symporter, BASS family